MSAPKGKEFAEIEFAGYINQYLRGTSSISIKKRGKHEELENVDRIVANLILDRL